MCVLKYIAAVGSLTVCYFVMRYNLHMIQLNGYKNKEHIGWLKKNSRKQRLLVSLAIVALGAIVVAILSVAGKKDMFAGRITIYILSALIWLICLRYYLYLKKSNTKKKLVFTKRVKRLVVTDAILVLGLTAVGIFLFDGKFISAFDNLKIALQPVLVLACNYINAPIEKGINNYYINDAKKRLRANKDMIIVGITGSYGKTSMKFYLETLLREHFNVLVTPESFNTPMGIVRTVREHLTPMHEIFLCEMGARHVGDIKELCDIVHPMHGVITSVGPQHLETFFNIENVTNTKFELADAIKGKGKLFLNGDNELIINKSSEYDNKVMYYTENVSGVGNVTDTDSGSIVGYRTKDIKLSPLGTEFTVIAPDGSKETFNTRLIGSHNVVNIVGAISVACELGVELKKLKTAVRRIQPVPHRLQLLERGNYTIIDDAFNSNPVGSKVAVETLAMFEGVRIVVTPGMVELGEKEEEYNYKFGTYAAKCCDYILLVGKKHTEPIKQGVIDSGFDEDKCKVYDTLEEAMQFAYSINQKGHKYILLENDLPDNY